MTIQKLMVAGAGQMGAGIAQAAAASGLQVILQDITLDRARQGYDLLNGHLRRDVEKGRRSEADAEAILGRITLSSDLEDARRTDMVIEAVSENRSLKEQIFRQLDDVCPPGAILASNTSSLSITRLAAVTKRPDRVIGMHFMNPVPLMPLVEVIRGLETSDDTLAAVLKLAARMGKTAVEAGDYPGFVSNRVLMPMINEAVFCVYEGVATPEAVDAMMKLGMKHPLGPLALADLIGLDTCLSIMETLQEGFGDSKYRPCPLLRQYVHAGRLGRKAGRGFYSYD